VGSVSSKRGDSRARIWQAGLLVLVVAVARGMIRPGATWGTTAYNPASDPYSMQNVTAGDGAQSWWRAGYTGKGVDVALIDTGVSPVPGLRVAHKILNGPDLSLESQDPALLHLDTNGHGTFMAGIIGGNDGRAGGYRGVAPDSRILSVKVGDGNGAVDVSQVIAAIDWVVQHRFDHGLNIRVINLSYGTTSTQPYTVDPLAYAAEQAWKAGIVVVAATGNTGLGSGLSDPAYDPWLISVGAASTMGTPTMHDDRVAAFSSGAPAACRLPGCTPPTLVAPGAHMQGLRNPGSYIDQNNPGSALGNLYFRGSGSSEAAAYVSGAVALLLQKYPLLTPDQVKKMLFDHGETPLRGTPGFLQGHGELDLRKLLSATALRSTPPPPHGAAWSSGSGSLELARGGAHLTMDGVALQGEEDIFGQPFDALAMAALEAAEHSWSGGKWNGSTWTGIAWSGDSWTGSTWSGHTWSGSTWSGSTWSASTWSGSTWSDLGWSGDQWLGATWGRRR
jgi:serine protease AprX